MLSHGIAIRRAFRLFSTSKSCYRYRATFSEENALIAYRLLIFTNVNRRGGFGLCFLYL